MEFVRIGFATGDASTLAGLPCHVPRERGSDHPTPNPNAGKHNDAQNYGDADAYAAGEIKKDGLDVHRDSVNLIAGMRNVTLVSSMVRTVL